MSSLIFATEENQILVATDTLAVTSIGEPFSFTTKATFIPHIRTIIAGTGAGGFASEWTLIVSTQMIVKGIQNLNHHTPKELRKLWIDYKKRNSFSEDITTTVYQFGFSEKNEGVISFAYRSINDFKSEKLEYGTGVKPECSVPEGNLFDLIPSMMQEQRERQEILPKNERLYIGGEIFALYLTADGCQSINLGRFPDFKQHERAIFKNFEEKHS